jgi:hypothetical protein
MEKLKNETDFMPADRCLLRITQPSRVYFFQQVGTMVGPIQ